LTGLGIFGYDTGNMSPKYDLETLRAAIKFNTVEVIPNDDKALDEELKVLIEASEKSGEPIRHYIGFEISGQIHIGTGIMSGLKIARLQAAGVECNVWLADYHTWINGKLDGKIETIRRVSREYFEPMLRISFELAGCDVSKIKFLSAEEEYKKQKNGLGFWDVDLMVSKNLTLSRVLKSISVTGKTAGNDVDFGTLRYAPMQVADCFWLQTHIVHAGMDQRKCHVLMREVAPKLDYEVSLKLGGKKVKPIAVHHGLLHGLGNPERVVDVETDLESAIVGKMSKSKPDTCIFVHDTVKEIDRKLKKGFCPTLEAVGAIFGKTDVNGQELTDEWYKKVVTNLNPILNWCEKMIFPAGKVLEVKRDEKWGGDKTYFDYDELEADYLAAKLHPGDLKPAVARCLVEWFTPARSYVEANPEGLEFLKSIKK
jgi:tyrosyl-tRNA synthetase